MGFAARAGAFTYTSVDRGYGRGGYQVKDCIGLDEAEAAGLVPRISRRGLDEGSLSPFPTPEEVGRAARRFSFTPSGPTGLYLHVAMAGRDATGRGGNTFAHIVVDDLSTPSVVRPIERWRSQEWLTPWGPDEVRNADLTTAAPPSPNPGYDRETVVRRLLDSDEWRLSLLPALLDAVAAAMAGGAPVVLATRDVDSAAFWVAAVSHLLSARTAQSFAFSLLEHAGARDEVPLATAAAEAGLHLVAVPIDQLDFVGNVAVAIAEDEEPRPGVLGGAPHRLARGDVTVTRWSVLALEVLRDEETALSLLAEVDRLEGEAGPHGDAPAWPMAMAIIRRLDEFEDVAVEASTEVLDFDLPADDPRWLREQNLALDRTFASTGDALEITRSTGTGERLRLHAADTYVQRALVQPEWLRGPDGASVPPVHSPVPPRVVTGAFEALEERRRTSDVPTTAHEELAMLSLVLGLGIDTTDPREVVEVTRARNQLHRRPSAPTCYLLLDPVRGPALVRAVGPVPSARTAIVRELDTHLGSAAYAHLSLGSRIPHEVLDWLDPDGPPADDGIDDAVDAEWFAREAIRADADGSPYSQPYAFWRAMHHESELQRPVPMQWWDRASQQLTDDEVVDAALRYGTGVVLPERLVKILLSGTAQVANQISSALDREREAVERERAAAQQERVAAEREADWRRVGGRGSDWPGAGGRGTGGLGALGNRPAQRDAVGPGAVERVAVEGGAGGRGAGTSVLMNARDLRDLLAQPFNDAARGVVVMYAKAVLGTYPAAAAYLSRERKAALVRYLVMDRVAAVGGETGGLTADTVETLTRESLPMFAAGPLLDYIARRFMPPLVIRSWFRALEQPDGTPPDDILGSVAVVMDNEPPELLIRIAAREALASTADREYLRGELVRGLVRKYSYTPGWDPEPTEPRFTPTQEGIESWVDAHLEQLDGRGRRGITDRFRRKG